MTLQQAHRGTRRHCLWTACELLGLSFQVKHPLLNDYYKKHGACTEFAGKVGTGKTIPIGEGTFVNMALPSASMRILSPTSALLLHASITNASLTETHAIVSTPFALISSAFSTKPGRCFRLHVGVKAPGTARMTVCAAQEIIQNCPASTMYPQP